MSSEQHSYMFLALLNNIYNQNYIIQRCSSTFSQNQQTSPTQTPIYSHVLARGSYHSNQEIRSFNDLTLINPEELQK